MKEVLNNLSPEEWGNKADVDKMYADGFTSRQDLSNASHSALQHYGVPLGQTTRLQDAEKDADAGEPIFGSLTQAQSVVS